MVTDVVEGQVVHKTRMVLGADNEGGGRVKVD